MNVIQHSEIAAFNDFFKWQRINCTANSDEEMNELFWAAVQDCVDLFSG